MHILTDRANPFWRGKKKQRNKNLSECNLQITMVGVSTTKVLGSSQESKRFGHDQQPRFQNQQLDASSFSEMVFGFLDDEGDSDGFSATSYSSSCNYGGDDQENEECLDEEKEKENNNSFWEKQHQLLQATLFRTSSVETRIRNVTKQTVEEWKIMSEEDDEQGNKVVCGSCGKAVCRNCLMREVSSRLQNEGFNSAICKSKWRSSSHMPSGEHSFVDVVMSNSSCKRGDEETRIIVELNFRAEFEMAKASEEYNRLVSRLPPVFVGKVERLKNLIRILCTAAKKCMKDKKMHMGPWRKHKYMQAKWVGPICERLTTTPSVPNLLNVIMPVEVRQPSKPKASMLTVVLMPNMHSCTAVEVL